MPTQPTDGSSMLVLTAVAVVAFLIYVLPTCVAVLRDHPSVGSIAVINLFLGWSLIGWVIALAWSFSAIPRTGAD